MVHALSEGVIVMDFDSLFEGVNVIGTSDLAEFTGLPKALICAWAAENGVDVVGNSYAFIEEDAQALAEELLDDDGEDDDEDDEDDEDDDE
jgi:hypothetical protein